VKLLALTLHLIVSTVPESLDPRLASSQVAQQISRLVYAPLFILDNNLMPVPYLAEKVTQKNALTYLITLKKNLFFHNGDKLEAKDVVYTYENPGQAEIKAPILSIKALSHQVVEFKLKKPYAPFLNDLSGLGIVSLKETGSGPYVFKKHNSATETYDLEAFDKWFEGQPKIKNIQIRVIRDANTRLLELIKGKADFASGNIKAYQLTALEKYPSRLRIEQTPGLDYAYLAMNLRRPPLSDIRVRKAIAHALDIDSILKAKFHGMATRATGLLPKGHWAKDPDLKLIDYNPEKSRKLLKETGFKLPLKLTLLAGTDRFRQSISLIYKQQLKQVGIDIEVRVQDWATTYAQMKQGQFDLYSAIWTPVVEPNLFDWVFHSNRIPSGENAGGNRGAYIDLELDKLIERAQESSSISERQRLYFQIEHRLLEALPYVPLWFEDNITITNKRLMGFEPTRNCSFLPLTHAYLTLNLSPPSGEGLENKIPPLQLLERGPGGEVPHDI